MKGANVMENKTALKDTKGAKIVKTICGETAAWTTNAVSATVIAVTTAPWVYRGRFKHLKMACVIIGGSCLGASFGKSAGKQVEEFVDDFCDCIDGCFDVPKSDKTQSVTN
jgi:hypothetical protein